MLNSTVGANRCTLAVSIYLKANTIQFYISIFILCQNYGIVFQTSDNPRCSMRPGSFMPCVTYRLPISVASCDCRLRKY